MVEAGPTSWFRAALELDGWMRARGYLGYDPYDGLASPWVRRFSFGLRWPAVVWTQVGRRSPWDVRGLLGVPAMRNPKGIALVLAAHVRLAEATAHGRSGEKAGDIASPPGQSARSSAEDRFRQSAGELVRWLASAAIREGERAGWGYPFPWANRDFCAPAGTPSSVVTAFVGHALLDAAETLGTGEPEAQAAEQSGELARSAGQFLSRGLNRLPGPGGTVCFSYTPDDRRAVHNANLLAASLLARLAASTGDDALAADALLAARFSARAQRSDGSWPYGVGARNAWVDSFHTSYCLVALDEVRRRLETREFHEVIARGLAFWRRAFFRGPAVGLHPHRPYPVDTHAVAHAILTLLAFRDEVPDAVPLAKRLARWCLSEMRDTEGFFYYRRYRFFVNRIPYMRWTQAWMLRALAELALCERVTEPEPLRAGPAGG